MRCAPQRLRSQRARAALTPAGTRSSSRRSAAHVRRQPSSLDMHAMVAHTRRLRTVALSALLLAAPRALAAQTQPDQAAALLRSNPDLINDLRARLRSSGLSPDQVRALLRAQGYPENLLDSVLE